MVLAQVTLSNGPSTEQPGKEEGAAVRSPGACPPHSCLCHRLCRHHTCQTEELEPLAPLFQGGKQHPQPRGADPGIGREIQGNQCWASREAPAGGGEDGKGVPSLSPGGVSSIPGVPDTPCSHAGAGVEVSLGRWRMILLPGPPPICHPQLCPCPPTWPPPGCRCHPGGSRRT